MTNKPERTAEWPGVVVTLTLRLPTCVPPCMSLPSCAKYDRIQYQLAHHPDVMVRVIRSLLLDAVSSTATISRIHRGLSDICYVITSGFQVIVPAG